jgi:deazaflavin-dependent oxidoreductase (nitroreductase family)
MLRDLIRSFNKRVFNRVIMRVAGKRHSPIVVVRHVGRKSGKSYETPVIVAPIKDGFLFALTYGPEVDWFRNVSASGRCALRWHGRTYDIESPKAVGRASAVPEFPLPLSVMLKALGTRHFVVMKKR